ncbi:hypothetical protein DFP93_12536 [Aneurinibacillus soli]|uniref:Uncharacterized protein n=1 Tax=Aneurinibacillus soli TaxID=1500254 RepID=A0A0U5B026_9BACL|nr:hypothetical protein [Aneurinibacillus soli]PYE58190.1 hypothetical protein DFP93_12536 [Aneurinibacillus soli]BAU27906.1 hypothetical protein CB4_02080 [Aneurinibacillus soli]
MLGAGRDNPEDTTTVTLSVKFTTKLDHFVVVNVELKGHIVSESVRETRNMGRAELIIFDEELISGSKIDYLSYCLDKSDPKNFYALYGLQKTFSWMDTNQLKLKGRIAYLHHFEIFTPYRGTGFARPYIWLLLQELKEELEVDGVMLIAYPFKMEGASKEEFRRQKRILEKLYIKAGFSILKEKEKIYSKTGVELEHLFCDIKHKIFSEFTA